MTMFLHVFTSEEMLNFTVSTSCATLSAVKTTRLMHSALVFSFTVPLLTNYFHSFAPNRFDLISYAASPSPILLAL